MTSSPRTGWLVLVLLPAALHTGANSLAVAAPVPQPRPRLDRLGDPVPVGAVARLGAARLWQGERVDALAFFPDGRTLAAHGGRFLRFWDTTTGRERFRLETGPAPHVSLALSPDGKTLACGEKDGQVGIWEVASRRKRATVGIKGFEGVECAFAPDGRTLAVTQYDGKGAGCFGVWKVSTATLSWRIIKLLALGPAVFTPDGKRLVTVGYTPVAQVWDVASGKEVRRLIGPQTQGLPIALLSDGKTLVVPERGQVRFWDLTTGKRLPRDLRLLDSRVAFSRDGNLLAWEGDKAVHVTNLLTGKEVHRLTGAYGIDKLTFSRDGRALAAVSADGLILLWHVENGRNACPLPGRRFGTVSSLTYHPGGRLLAVGGYGGVTLWEVASGRELRHLPLSDRATQERVSAIAFSADGRQLAAAGAEGMVRVWETATGKVLHRLRGRQKRLYQIGFSRNGRVLRSAARSGPLLWHWNLADGRRPRQFFPKAPWVERVAWSPDGKLFAAGSGGKDHSIGLWELPGGKGRAPLIAHRHTADFLQFSPDGQRLVSSSLDEIDSGTYIWDATTSRMIQHLKYFNNSFTFSPDGRLIAGIGNGGPIHLWEIASGRLAGVFPGHESPPFWAPFPNEREPNLLAFAPDGRTIASCGRDATVLLWDVTGFAVARDAKAPPPSPQELAALWKDLAANDAAIAQRAVWRFIAAPAQAVPYLESRLRHIAPPDRKKIQRLLKDLDDDDFDLRQRAARDLETLEDCFVPVLRKAREDTRSIEVRHALDLLLAKRGGKPRPLSAAELRSIRSLQVLEQIGSCSARRVVRKIAEGNPKTWLSQQARATLERLTLRSIPLP